ncbi:ADP-ribose pyrophosphatase [Secundilactobacillus paracollinoides]|uniref:ADP-ribose pyrophosphatase n=1 Tax=Secundilactobacillus paracollinoides TaxID=240427 RepID=A0A1B2J031_9LACO|nr:NUDIX hydrolase [Secundilactobacillus paracollinoides]ANZ61767.1 ADP-ribose pyrophosphatase [Secundilactobacillus paracollinoides]ANZ63402.1 ADP-ribose pyrophosphatase [Secundilactobacillus paracollinoides]ANZ67686.1 ADP-ribose pyrophosphatase [Secundilactobacillus paracollinoides]
MKMEERVISTEKIYDGAIINVERETVELPDGHQSYREIVRHAGAVAVLAITDDNKVILVKQWRSPIAKPTLEIPAGKLDDRDNGDALHAVNRELNEEIRLQATQLKKVTGFYSSVGFSDEYMTLYVAKDLKPVADELPRDPGEDLNVKAYSLDELKALMATGEIEDAKTTMAVWYFELMQLKQAQD